MSTDLGERFARALAAQNADALKKLLVDKVSFRALTPGRYWQSDDAREVVDEMILGIWFSPERSITRILEIDSNSLGAVDHVSYRFAATLSDGEFIIEQQAYFQAENEKISWLQILCSGFVRAE